MLKQIKENKEKRELEKHVDLIFDQQRIAVNDQVNRNQREFAQRNYDVAKNAQQFNKMHLDERRHNEMSAKLKDQSQDDFERDWTNSTQLKYSEKKSYADKFLK